MNKHLSRVEIEGIARTTDSFVDMLLTAPTKPHPGAPFNKRAEGRARREARRNRIAEKWAWMESE